MREVLAVRVVQRRPVQVEPVESADGAGRARREEVDSRPETSQTPQPVETEARAATAESVVQRRRELPVPEESVETVVLADRVASPRVVATVEPVETVVPAGTAAPVEQPARAARMEAVALAAMVGAVVRPRTLVRSLAQQEEPAVPVAMVEPGVTLVSRASEVRAVVLVAWGPAETEHREATVARERRPAASAVLADRHRTAQPAKVVLVVP